MNVKDLIEELKKLDETVKVFVPLDSFYEGFIEVINCVDIITEDGELVASIC